MNSYQFVDGEFTSEIVIKRSRFIATVFGEVDADSAQEFVDRIKSKYPDARHNCYAYISDIAGNAARFSDDGEPAGTAAQPMLAVLKKRGLKCSAAVVTRYFGGIKLGAGGLVSAYTSSLTAALENAKISEKTLATRLNFDTDYSIFSLAEGYMRSNGILEDISYESGVSASLWVREDNLTQVIEKLLALSLGKITIKEDIKDYKVLRGIL